MEIKEIIKKLEETSGTEAHKEILKLLSDEQIKEVVSIKYANNPNWQKAIIYQGYKKQASL